MSNALMATKNVTVGESYDVIVVGGGLRGAKQCIFAGSAEPDRSANGLNPPKKMGERYE